MGAITAYTKALNDAAQEVDQVFTPKKPKPVVPVTPPPPPPTPPPKAIPTQDEMNKKIAGFKKKGWIK